jgi:hypothetical protein
MLLSHFYFHAEVLAAQAAAAAAIHFANGRNYKLGSRHGSATQPRQRRTVREVYTCLGAKYFRRAYRMTYRSFLTLHQQLKYGIEAAHREHMEKMKRQRRALRRRSIGSGRRRLNNPPPPPIPNGRISTDVRLGCALRYFAGGSPYDIMSKYGVSHTEMMYSVWYVVEATNKKQQWYIEYPQNHREQQKIADEFRVNSSVDFACCAGSIDGIVIWMNRPTLKEASKVGVDQQKFYCGRKHKFGLNCQAVCDVRGRFLDISITSGAASSDLLAFENSKLYKQLEHGILATGLCLFGDNAYLNKIYMATPYPNTSGGPKDNYNFFHSQLRIRIECAFGMLVQRWGILRMAMPMGITVKKTIALVNCLAKLHNFCIDEADSATECLREDNCNIESSESGFVPMAANRDIADVLGLKMATPDGLLGGGHHFHDVPRAGRRDSRSTANAASTTELPRERLCSQVQSKHMVRPASNRRH